MDRPHPVRQTWRVRGVPPDLDERGLADVLRCHPDLRYTDKAANADDSSDNGVLVHTLAPDFQVSSQVATVRFVHLPTRLRTISRNGQLTIELHVSSENTRAGNKRKLQAQKLTIDQHFDGITVLVSPPVGEHQIDVLAISGLGSHPFGSFAHKGDGHMWLSDSLPQDMPMARVMTYGYKSALQGSTSFADLGNLANGLKMALYQLLGPGKQGRLVLIGHSLGGLLVKEALVQITESESESEKINLVSGCLFFGVPNDGMDIESLIPMVNDQPNRFLLESLAPMNFQILGLQKRNFSSILSRADFEVFCFFETRLSLTAAKDPETGDYKMVGLPRCLVTERSATSCLPTRVSPDYSVAMDRTHSELVKFATHDSEFGKVRYVLGRIYRSCLATLSRPVGIGAAVAGGEATTSLHRNNGQDGSKSSAAKFLVPHTNNPDFVGRSRILEQLTSQLGHGQNPADGTLQPRVSLHGLGGIGKTQIALAYVYWLRATYPHVSVFWVHASSAERFRQAYAFIAEECRVHGYDDPKTNVLSLVKIWLQSKDRGRWLMVIDNADDAQLFSYPESLGKWIPECAQGSVLVTTRNKVAGSRLTQGRCLIEVGRMDEGESRQLLQEKLEADGLDLDDLLSLSSRLEHLPLALAQAAAFIQEMSIPVNDYIRLLEKSDQHLVDLLSEEFETVGRDSEASRAVAETWILSFEQIQQQDTFAGELLSLMSLFDRQAIPQEFLSNYSERQSGQEPREIQMVKALGILKGFSFVVEEKGHGFDMHRLVQLVTRKWLTRKGTIRQFVRQAILTVSHTYPYGNHENRAICGAYIAHVHTVLKLEGTELKDERLARASLLHCAAGFFDYQGLWKDAEGFFIQAMKVRGELLGEEHLSTLTSMANLALTYSNQGRWKEAESLGMQVMETKKKVLGEEHPHTLTSMNNLASTYRDQGQWRKAEKLEVQVMEICKKKLGTDHPYTLSSIKNLGSTYRNQGRWKEAEDLFVQVMKTSKTKLRADHPDTLTNIANLALTYMNQGRWEEAEKLFVQVVEARKIQRGIDHPHTLTSMANLASTYMNQGRWEEAKRLFVQVIETSRTKLGTDHPHTLTNMANLALTYRKQGRWKEAEKLFIQVVEARKTKLGTDHPHTLSSIANLASTYMDQGRWKEAEKLFIQVMETSRAKLGTDHPDTLSSMANLGSTYRNQGRWEEAEKIFVQVMETRKMKLGTDHPETLSCIKSLASTYRNQGRWEKAERLFIQAMEVYKAKLGINHPDTLTTIANLGLTYMNQGRWEEAEKLFLQVIEIRKTKLGANHPDTLTSIANLALAYTNQGRWEEAEKLEVQVMEIRKTKLGADHPYTLSSMNNLASTYRNQGRWEEAEKLFLQATEIRKTKLGTDHPDTLISMANLACTWRDQGRYTDALRLMRICAQAQERVLGSQHPDALSSLETLGKWSS